MQWQVSFRGGFMSRRPLLVLFVAVLSLAAAGIAVGIAGGRTPKTSTGHKLARPHSSLPENFKPAILRADQGLNRYFVVVDGPSVASKERARGNLSASGQRKAAAAARE